MSLTFHTISAFFQHNKVPTPPTNIIREVVSEDVFVVWIFQCARKPKG